MKRSFAVLLSVVALTGIAVAQDTAPPVDTPIPVPAEPAPPPPADPTESMPLPPVEMPGDPVVTPPPPEVITPTPPSSAAPIASGVILGGLDKVAAHVLLSRAARRVKVHRSYTVEEAARTLGIHKNTVRRWATARYFPRARTAGSSDANAPLIKSDASIAAGENSILPESIF